MSEVERAFEAGKAEMLRLLLAEAEEFRAAMKRRRYFNNANGVGRLIAHIETKWSVSS